MEEMRAKTSKGVQSKTAGDHCSFRHLHLLSPLPSIQAHSFETRPISAHPLGPKFKPNQSPYPFPFLLRAPGRLAFLSSASRASMVNTASRRAHASKPAPGHAPALQAAFHASSPSHDRPPTPAAPCAVTYATAHNQANCFFSCKRHAFGSQLQHTSHSTYGYK